MSDTVRRLFASLRIFIIFAYPLLLYSLHAARDSHSRHFMHNGFNRTNPHSMELIMLYRESEIFKHVVHVAKGKGYTIKGFYHASTWQPQWKDVIGEQLKLVDGRRRIPLNPNATTIKTAYEWDNRWWTSLLDASDSLYLNVAGPTPKDRDKVLALLNKAGLKYREKITVGFNRTVGRTEYMNGDEAKKRSLDAQPQLSAGEYSTVNMLHDYCIDKFKRKEKAIVYYFHSKSTCCYKPFGDDRKMPRASWRELMNAFNLEFPSICVRAMLKGYNTCGVENQDAHYSGNFWWANCDHIAQLKRTERFNPWDQEFFVQRYSVDAGFARKIGYHCGYCMYNCGVNLYDVDCRRDWYREKIFKMVMGQIGPSNRGKPRTNETGVCRDTRVKPYNENQPFMREQFKTVGIS